MTSEIQQNRYDQLIRRVGGIIGPGSKVAEVITELFPMIDVENVPSELLILGGTRVCMGGGTITGAVGESPKTQLFNPDGSSMLVIIERIVISTNASNIVRWGRSNAVFGTDIATAVFRDTRNPVFNRPIAQVRTLSAVALASATNQVRINQLTELSVESPNDVVILSPGEGFEIGVATTNTAIYFGFTWRERVAESSELNL